MASIDQFFSILECIKKDNLEKLKKVVTDNESLNPNRIFDINDNFLEPMFKNNARLIHFAIFYNARKIVDYLFAFGISADILDDKGRHMIHFAAASRSVDMYQKIEEKFPFNGADYADYLPLHYAIIYGSADILQYMWMADKNIYEPLEGRISSFCLACASGKTEVVDLYLALDEEKDLLNDMSDSMPPSFFLTQPNTDIFNSLIEHGFDLDHDKDIRGDTLLMYWVRKNNYKMINAILSFTKDLYVRDKSGFTAFEIAQRKGNAMVLTKFSKRFEELKQ